ncbi:MAG: hypothetical protein IT368_00315 [Candidatus Hydrogenedentes bacterium]|nr:hypothetical protein [Candidatus Hydrogenedentota bacterium]
MKLLATIALSLFKFLGGFAGTLLVLIVVGVWLLGYLTGMVWLPDAIFRHWNVAGEVETPELGQAKLVQRWGDDFYTTLLVHKSPSGQTDSYMIDSDDDKIWECESAFDSTSIRFLVDGESEVVFEDGAVKEVMGNNAYGKPSVDDIADYFSWR